MIFRHWLWAGLLWSGLLSAAYGESPSPGEYWPRKWALPSGITYQLRGRIDTDALWAAQTEKNEADFGKLGSTVGLRRARVGLEGYLGDEGTYVGEIDLASGEIVIRDLFVAQPSWLEGKERVGHFREPFSLEGGTSARFFAFMERSPANVLDPARNWGVEWYETQMTECSFLAMGAFYGGADANDFEGGPGSAADLTARWTAAPINEEEGRYLVHLGCSVVERIPLDGIIVLNQKPRSPLLTFGDSTNSAFVPTVMISAEFQQLINTQLALVHGPVWAQAEWYGSIIDQTEGGTVFYQGNHVDVGYFITGEHRAYDARSGVFEKVQVHRPFLCGPASRGRELGPGAWEIVARLAWLDFVDPDTPLGPGGQLQGLQLTQATFGLNWYLTDSLRMMLNYSYAEPTEPNLGQSSAHIFGTRLAYYW